MAIIQALCTTFNQQCLEAIHDFRMAGDTFKIALYTDQAELGPQTTAYTTAGEVVASGYTAGGQALTNLGTASYGTVGYASFGTVSWVSTGIEAMGAMIYNSTAVGYTNPAVAVLNFGMNRSAVSGVFTITFPTNNNQFAIIRLNAPLA